MALLGNRAAAVRQGHDESQLLVASVSGAANETPRLTAFVTGAEAKLQVIYMIMF